MNKDFAALLNIMNDYYLQCSTEWKRRNYPRYNLKDKQVCDIQFDNELYSLIINYQRFLQETAVEFMLKIEEMPNVEARIKHINSIEYKINAYKESPQHGRGTVPINKCLNDLMGVRIILDREYPYEEIHDYVKNIYASFKIISKNKNGYIATHIYFRTSNYSFPWELQVWSQGHAVANKHSHSVYKQEYTSWENENILKEKGEHL